MNLGVQYYRPPFPLAHRWEEDLSRIRDAGMNTVQLWVLWSWVEATPGQFRFEDYDRLVEGAEKRGLGVVLSTIAEVQPLWIHREVPGSEMVDHMGRKVVSSQRLECHFGLTPGGCTDHPGVWERMRGFLVAVAERYREARAIRGWDAWNELRWNVQADGYVCYCPHTLAAFREWLRGRHGSLEGLNEAWLRRYASWEDVMPGKLPVRPFTEMMAFQHFLTWRANQHGRARYEVLKAAGCKQPVTVHPASPSPLEPGGIASTNDFLREHNQAVNRGNDWFYADDLDGIGCSSFPKWGREDDTDFAVRMSFMASAARGKPCWLSELQGAASATENTIHEPVRAAEQQRWLWQGIAAGATTVLFWCWRDEVFGREAGGFGISGSDGYAPERLEGMKRTGDVLDRHADLLSGFRPDPPQAAVLFSPQSYYLAWCQEGHAGLAMQSVRTYCRSLSRLGIPWRVVEEEHLDALDGIKVLFLPRVNAMSPEVEERLEAFVEQGGVLFAESETGAFDHRGIWRYPEERMLARLTGVREFGRRPLAARGMEVRMDGRVMWLPFAQWLTPMAVPAGAESFTPQSDPAGEGSLFLRTQAGHGTVWMCGTHPGNAPAEKLLPDFDALIARVAESAEVHPPIRVLHPAPESGMALQLTTGRSAGRRVVFLFAPPDCGAVRLRVERGYFTSDTVRELFSGGTVHMDHHGTECEITQQPGNFGINVLTDAP